MLPKWLKAVFGLGLIVGCGFFVGIVWPRIVNHVAGHAILNKVAHRVADAHRTNFEKAWALTCFVHFTLASPDTLVPPTDAAVAHHLLRGVGWCDQKASTLMQLLAEVDILARVVMFHSHTVCEVFVDGRWTIFDPQLCRWYRTDINSNALGISELQQNPVVIDHRGLMLDSQEWSKLSVDAHKATYTMPSGFLYEVKEMICNVLQVIVPSSLFQFTVDDQLPEVTTARHAQLLGFGELSIEMYKQLHNNNLANYFLFFAHLEQGNVAELAHQSKNYWATETLNSTSAGTVLFHHLVQKIDAADQGQIQFAFGLSPELAKQVKEAITFN